jgi:hypothetical protein
MRRVTSPADEFKVQGCKGVPDFDYLYLVGSDGPLIIQLLVGLDTVNFDH